MNESIHARFEMEEFNNDIVQKFDNSCVTKLLLTAFKNILKYIL